MRVVCSCVSCHQWDRPRPGAFNKPAAKKSLWSRLPDLNRRPTDYESGDFCEARLPEDKRTYGNVHQPNAKISRSKRQMNLMNKGLCRQGIFEVIKFARELAFLLDEAIGKMDVDEPSNQGGRRLMPEDLSKCTIRRKQDEAYCAWCGNALYVGDKAYIDLRNRFFCSQECSEKYHRKARALAYEKQANRNLR